MALTGAAGPILKPDLILMSRAWAESDGASGAASHELAMRFARLLYPHDSLPDEVYAGIIDQALGNVATGKSFAAQLDAAAAELDERAGGDWLQIDTPAQVDAMKSIDTLPIFTAILNQVRFGLYFSPAYWAHIGYAGPSKDFGGYLHHGAGEIDWLPEEVS
jgi:hypothetical protein